MNGDNSSIMSKLAGYQSVIKVHWFRKKSSFLMGLNEWVYTQGSMPAKYFHSTTNLIVGVLGKIVGLPITTCN